MMNKTTSENETLSSKLLQDFAEIRKSMSEASLDDLFRSFAESQSGIKRAELEDGNVLARLLRVYNEEDRSKNWDAGMNAFGVLLCILRDSQVIVPYTQISNEDTERFLAEPDCEFFITPEGEIVKADIIIKNDASREKCFPIFSQPEQILQAYKKAYEGKYLNFIKRPFTEFCESVRNSDVKFINVDPFTYGIAFDKERIDNVLRIPSMIEKGDCIENTAHE